ncbi:MAG: ferritin [Planctomycetes bacterium]|nr:ferritin [Planctomycetota bacterium]
MDKAKVIDKLNQAVTLELTGLLQYNQYAQVLVGQDRKVWEGFFKDNSDEALAHARKFASRVVSLGGVPSTETHPIKPATMLHEMLEHSLEHERHAITVYEEALTLCQDNTAYRNLLEDQIQTETDDAEELEKFLGQVIRLAGHHHRRMSKTA